VADFYQAYMNQQAIDARGLAPLQPLLKSIAAIGSRTDLARVLGANVRADVDAINSTDLYTENLFGFWTVQGLDDPHRYHAYLLQGGLGMPDRAYYLTDSPKMAELRTKYIAHIAAMFKLAGMPDAEQRAQRVFDLEKTLAAAHAPREESSDVTKVQKWARADFDKKAPGMDWNAFFAAAGLDKEKHHAVASGLRGRRRGRRAGGADRDLEGLPGLPRLTTITPTRCRKPSASSSSRSSAPRCRARRSSRRAPGARWPR
jgi:putative endopeptidase